MNFMTPLAVRVGSISWMPKLLPQITAIDKFIQRVSKGRVTILDIAGLPNLTLTVNGRKSGVPRTTPLLCTPYESGYLICGSNFGGAKQPVWVVNVRAAEAKGERVGVLAGGSRHQAAVREVTGAERDQLWARMTKTWPNYALYAERTERRIPVFHLDPVA
jgi:deazaflavin-dependent oxidoreductase (nitroreductase family)